MNKKHSMCVSVQAVGLLILVFLSIYSLSINVFWGVSLYKIVFPLITLYFIYHNKCGKNSIKSNLKISSICWGILIFWGIISFIWIEITGNELEFLSFDLSWICIAICFSVFSLKTKNRDRIMKYFCFFAMILGIMGMFTSISGYYFNDTHISYHYTRNFLGLYRPNGIFYNVNDHAVFMFFSIVVLLLWTENKNRKNFLRLIGILIYGLNIILVDSRGVELALMVFFAIYLFKTRKIKIIYKLAIVTGIMFFILFSMESIMEMGIFSEGLNDSGRFDIIKLSLSNLAKTNFMGVGPGNITAVNSSLQSAEMVSAPHNFFLEIFCDYGVIGLVVIVIWYISNLRSAFHLAKKDSGGIVIYAALLSFMIISIVSSSLIGKVWVASFFGILIAYMNSLEVSKRITK